MKKGAPFATSPDTETAKMEYWPAGILFEVAGSMFVRALLFFTALIAGAWATVSIMEGVFFHAKEIIGMIGLLALTSMAYPIGAAFLAGEFVLGALFMRSDSRFRYLGYISSLAAAHTFLHHRIHQDRSLNWSGAPRKGTSTRIWPQAGTVMKFLILVTLLSSLFSTTSFAEKDPANHRELLKLAPGAYILTTKESGGPRLEISISRSGYSIAELNKISTPPFIVDKERQSISYTFTTSEDGKDLVFIDKNGDGIPEMRLTILYDKNRNPIKVIREAVKVSYEEIKPGASHS